MLNRYLLTSGLLALILLGIKISVELNKTTYDETDEYSSGKSVRKNKIKTEKYTKSTTRTPASSTPGSQINNGPSYAESQKNENLFQNKTDEKLEAPGGGYAGLPSSGFQAPNYAQKSRGSSGSSSSNKTSGSTASKTGGIVSTIVPFPAAQPGTTTGGTSGGTTGSSSGGGGGGATENISCVSNLGTGAFSSPQIVTLSCTSNSEIKYCISENTCCDPDSGSTYTAPINVGTFSGTYCLSFQGSSIVSSATSPVTEISYSFNAELPDLQVAHQKIVYQTTELQGQLNITSDDFGTNQHSMGVINLKNHDPGLAGLNWSCSDILNDYTTLTAAVPAVPMVRTDIAPIPNSSQIDVFLNNLNLDYGQNYVTSFVSNDSFMDSFVSCSSTMVTLEDFEYFEGLPNQGEVGTNDVREFSGGFTHLGFFEPEATVYRGPAGLGSENVATQELKSGMFGVFY